MTDSNINGMAGSSEPLSFILDDTSLYSLLHLPGSAQQVHDGTRPILITAVAPFMAGRGANRVASVWVEGANGRVSSEHFGLGANSRAVYQGMIGLRGNGYLVPDIGIGTLRVGFYANGGFYVGRNPMAGNNVWNEKTGGTFLGSSLAGDWRYIMSPSAPLFTSASQAGLTSAKVTWSAPAGDGGSPLQGYKVEWAKDAAFTNGYGSMFTGVTNQVTISNLPPGVYYFRVSAINVVNSVSLTLSPYSNTATTTVIAETGNLDNWQAFGALPPNAQPLTAQGLRRAVLTSVPGAPSAILRENNVVGGPAYLSPDNYGGKRTVTGLTPGATYRLSASCGFIGALDAESPNVYQLGVMDIGWASPVEITKANSPFTMPILEFVATATSHEIAFRLAETAGRASPADLERFALWGVSLSRMPSGSPFRLQNIVYQSSLINHFDLACNSIGARWWVDSAGVTQFSADLGDEGSLAVFTDVRASGKLEYIDVRTSYDTRNVVNDLTVNQHGAYEDEDGWKANDYSDNFKDITAIATWGARAGSMDTSLYDEGAYAGSVQSRAVDIVTDSSTPEITLTQIRWNAQEDPILAAQLDIYSRVDVEFRGVAQPSRIVNIRHDIKPERWIMTLELARRE